MNDASIASVLRYMQECLREPKQNWTEAEFKKRSYSRWTANTILELLMDHPTTPASMLIDEFIIRMCCYSCSIKNESTILSIAIDVAEHILYLIEGGKP